MLTSTRNPMVKQFRKLHQTKIRQQQGMFVIEGTHLLEEACAAEVGLSVVCHTEGWQQSHPSLWKEAIARAQRTDLVSEAVLKAMATTVTPDGVVAIAQSPLSPPLSSAITSREISPFLGVAVEALQDPGNLGTIIRTAAAVGVHGLWVSSNSVDLTHPKVLRASAGQWFRLPMYRKASLVQAMSDLQQTIAPIPLQIIATTPNADLSYWDIDYTKPSVLLVGNEGAGLSQELIHLADQRVQIPSSPAVESLNVAIATALVLYEAKRQRCC